MDRPITNTSSHRPRSSARAASAAASQSPDVVWFISCQLVPWPGSSGSDTLRPASARKPAHGRRDWGLPVKP